MTPEHIDIERLREAVKARQIDFQRTPDGSYLWDVTEEEEALWLAGRFLVALADEGGELWMEKKCPHGMALNYGHDHFLDGHCDGGSRERVWPPTEGET